MPISYAEYARLSCPACGAGFDADVWTLVDAAERPDLAQALRDGALNVATCPRCGYAGPAGAPLLFHDPVGRRVYFAVPPGVDEHAWRERAQSLLYLLAGSLPEEDRRPYLGDVQVEHEVDGVRRAILRRERGRRSDRATGRPGDRATETPVVRDVVSSPPRPVAPPPEDPSELLAAIRALLAADSEAEFAATVAANPRLLSDEGDAAIAQLADLAYDQGERDVAAALREARVTLARMRAGGRGQRPEARDQPSSAYDSVPDPRPPTPDPQLLSDSAYQALLHVDSPHALIAATRDYPALLEEWAGADLAARTEAALEEGNERLARTIEMHREALADLRARVGGEDALLRSVRALLEADGEEAIADVIAANPILLTDAAQDALFGLAAGARTQGDEDLAEYAISCRAMLRTVRAGLEDS